MKNIYFAITSSQNINLPESKLLSKMPHQIILKNLKPLHLSEGYTLDESNTVESNLLNVLAWLKGKKGNILLVDESSVCLSSGTIDALIKSVDNDNPFSVITSLDGNGICAFCGDIESLLSNLNQDNNNSLNNLYFSLLSNNVVIQRLEIENEEEKLQIDGPMNYGQVSEFLRLSINESLMRGGVFIMDTYSTYIEYDVKIGSGTVVYPNNVITGETSIGKNCTLYPNSRIENAKIGDGNKIQSSVMLDCTIGNNNTVGPFAYIRPKTEIADNCRIGDFVEIKNSKIDNGTKVSHLTYVGDSDLGKNINLGCGVVFVNYDGKSKYRSTIGDNAFIGCNSNIVSPITIGNNAYIAAGATITENVPDDSLYIARSRGVIKENWAKERREKGKL